MSIRNFSIDNGAQGVVASVYSSLGQNVIVLLHKTVVFCKEGNEITLNNGGWFSASSKTVMNKCFVQLGINARVFQKKGKWYVELEDINGVKVVDYKNGMIIKDFN